MIPILTGTDCDPYSVRVVCHIPGRGPYRRGAQNRVPIRGPFCGWRADILLSAGAFQPCQHG